MRQDMHQMLEAIDKVNIKTIQELRQVDRKLKLFKKRLLKRPESIENRLKIIMVDNMKNALRQEQFVFKHATACHKKNIDKDIDTLFEQIKKDGNR